MNPIDRRTELACRLAELRRLAGLPKHDQRGPAEFATANAATRCCTWRVLGR
jgi:hypothetical protein